MSASHVPVDAADRGGAQVCRRPAAVPHVPTVLGGGLGDAVAVADGTSMVQRTGTAAVVAPALVPHRVGQLG